MKFNLGGAISGGLAGFASGGWAGAAGGALLGGFSGDDSANAEQAYNRQLNDSIKLWNMQNAYNDPVAQMQRLEKAGLNKYLVYSSGNVTGNSSSSINQPTLSYAQTNNQPLNNFLKALNIRSAKAETEGKEIDTEMRELDLQLKKARIAKLLTGNGGMSADKLLQKETKDEYDAIMRANRAENSIRGDYTNGFLGRLPIIGNYLSDIAYRNDKRVREGLAKKQGKQAWQIPFRSIFAN